MPTALEKQSRAREQRLVLKNIGIRVPPISRKPVRPASIKTIERSYLKDVLILLEPMYAAVEELLVPKIPQLVESFSESVRVDAINYAEALSNIFEQLSLEMLLTTPKLKVGAVALKNGQKTNVFNKTQVNKSIKSVLGIDLFRSEPWLASQLASFTERNVALIQSLPQAYFGRLQTKLRTEIEKGTSSSKIAKMVSEETGISKRHARLITRDQVSKFNGKLNELRMTESGITHYTWSTSGDEKVRKTHKSKNGKVFAWNKPPADTGHPGFDVQCRCVPIPVLDEFKEEPKRKKRR
jgi:SPP1 gp7 family putative phage head morphogenesis protein